MNEHNIINRAKNHVKSNKKVYIAAGAGVGIGLAICPKTLQLVDGFNFKFFSPTHNNVVQIALARRGHPGNIIVCRETGEAFASQNRAAEAMNISASTLCRHLKGLRDHVDGYHFDKVGEAV